MKVGDLVKRFGLSEKIGLVVGSELRYGVRCYEVVYTDGSIPSLMSEDHFEVINGSR